MDINYFPFCKEINKFRLRLIDGGHAKCIAGEWTATVTSPVYSRLYYILDGDAFLELDDKEYKLKAGFCYLLPTGFSFKHDCKSKMEQIYFHINLPDENSYDILRECREPICCPFNQSALETLKKAVLSAKIHDTLLVESILLSSISDLFKEHSFAFAGVVMSNCVRSAVTYIGKNPSIQMNLAELADKCFVSQSTLSKKFRLEIGKPIGGYIDDVVFFEAEQLLRSGGLNISEISMQLGFCDQFYFSRRFKEKYGMTPQQYRKTRVI